MHKIKDNIKVLHLNTYDNFGGAAKGMYILHKALLDIGIDSKVLVHHKDTDDNTVISLYSEKEKKERFGLDLVPLYLYPQRSLNHISNAIVDSNLLIETINKINPDIVHLHWINYAYLSIEDIQRINKPIIWTLRDMWAFTGGCHHTLNCERFKIGCGQCPILGTNEENDITKQQISRKIKAYNNSNITFVGISPWIKQKLDESLLLKKTNVKSIQIDNNFDSKNFYKMNKKEALHNLKLNTNKHIISIGANSLNDAHKGIKYFIEALSYLSKDNYLIILFGEQSKELLNQIPFEYKAFGFTSNYNILRNIYSASDVFVAPSLIEPFGKTIVEAMACGTPVVSFENSGGPDYIISHKIDGYKAKKFDSFDLATGIRWIIQKKGYLLENNAIRKASKFASDKIAKKYHLIYKNTLNTFIKNNTKKFQCMELNNSLIKIYQFKYLVNNFRKNQKILIYGYSYIGKLLYKNFPKQIIAFLDKDTSKIDNKLVYHPKDIHLFMYDTILVTVLNRFDTICEYLLSLNVKKDKITDIISLLR